jgi:hypothetical protein
MRQDDEKKELSFLGGDYRPVSSSPRRKANLACYSFIVICLTFSFYFYFTSEGLESRTHRAISPNGAPRPSNFTPKGKGKEMTIAEANNVHYLMTATQSTSGFCTSVAAALVNDSRPVVLGWNEANDQDYWMMRLRMMRDYLANETQEDDIVIMTDAYDVWLQRPLAEVIGKFKSTGKRILLGAERHCWTGHTFEQREGFQFCEDLPQSPLPADWYGDKTDTEIRYRRPRYLNAGSTIGYAQDLLTMYDAVLQLSAETKVKDDQGLLLVTMFQKKAPMALDYYGDVIKPMAECDQDMVVTPLLPRSPIRADDLNYPIVDSVSHSLLHGSTPHLLFEKNIKNYPGILHFNGPSKSRQSVFRDQMWWTPRANGSSGEDVWNKVRPFLKEQHISLQSRKGPSLKWSEFCSDTFEAVASVQA